MLVSGYLNASELFLPESRYRRENDFNHKARLLSGFSVPAKPFS
jgi:hypothetical protein